MADRLCRPCRDVARRQLRLMRDLNRPSVGQRAAVAEIARSSTRQFHQTAPSRSQGSPQPEKQAGVAQTLLGIASKILPSKAVQPYQIFGATESIYKACAAPANYKISPELRKKEEVPLTEDGEELGVGGGVWHDGTFSPLLLSPMRNAIADKSAPQNLASPRHSAHGRK